MRRIMAIATLAAILAACASIAPSRDAIPTRASDFRPSQIRQPVVFAQLRFEGRYSYEERQSMPQELEGVLLDELDARAVRGDHRPRSYERATAPYHDSRGVRRIRQAAR